MNKLVYICFLILVPVIAKAQYISSNNETFRTVTAYTNGIANDSVFIFCGNITPTLTARGVGATAPYTYKWYQYQNSIHQYASAPFQTNTGVTTSTVSGIATGGYKVAITDAGGVAVGCDIVWVWNINYPVNAGADVAGCSNFTLNGSYTTPGNKLRYYNPPEDAFLINAATQINVCFTATHTWVSDLAFYLVGPPSCGSPRVLLSPNPGAIGQGSTCNSGNNVSGLCFSNTSTNNLNVCTASTPLSGTYGTYGATPTAINWSPLYGCSATNGGWSVQIYDCIGADMGALTNSSITFSGAAACGSNTINYNSGTISSAINDNSCSPGTASIYNVPPAVVDTTSLFLTDAVTVQWTASPAASMSSPTNPVTNVNPNPTVNTTFVLSITGTYSCVFRDTALFTYTPPTVPVITPAGPYCNSSPAVTLTATPTGGIWTGTGISNAMNGTFNPTTAGIGTHTITYTIGGSCGGSTNTTVQVTATAAPAITAAGPFCSNSAAITLTATPTGGTWSGPGITNAVSGTFTPSAANIGTNTITYSVPGACGGTVTRNITVNATPNPVIAPAGPFCSDTGAVLLSATPTGGTWSGTGITGSTNGTFNSATSGAGSFSIVYAIGGVCPNSDTITIVVNQRATPLITAAGPFCETDPIQNLIATPAGGTWTGSGIMNSANGTFDPSQATYGNNLITYTVNTVCGAKDTAIIQVNQLLYPAIIPTGPFCINAAPQTLVASISGGVWSGPGIINPNAGILSPSNAGAGMHTITYTIPLACGAPATINITVNPLPVPDAGNNAAICAGNATTLSSPTGGMVSYLWTPSATLTPSSGQGQTVSALPTNTTTYYLNVTDANGCSASDSVTVTVNPLPVANFTADTVCVGACTQFTNLSTISSGNIASYFWNYGDAPVNGTSTLPNACYTYANANSYTVTLVVTSAANCPGVTTKQVLVSSNPVASFTKSDVCDGNAVVFNNTSTNTSQSLWTFGDGQSSTLTNPSHNYATAGTYNVLLTSRSAGGCIDTASATVTVFPNPVAGFSFTNVCDGTMVNFTDNSSIASGGIINFYTWDYNTDGSVDATSQNGSMLYNSSGTYNVTHNVVSNNSCSATITKTLTVFPVPDAQFTASTVCEGAITNFTNASTVSSPDTISTYNWNFGLSGNTSTTYAPGFTYPAGNYWAYLTVGTQNNCYDTDSIQVVVNPNPVVNFTTLTVASGCVPLCVTFTDLSTISSGSFKFWDWDFETGSSTMQSPTECFNSDGVYDVTLRVESDLGCADSLTIVDMITVHPLPDANFQPDPQTVTIFNPTVSFIDLSSGASSLWWDMGDSSDAMLSNISDNISHTYADTGTFIVTQAAMSQFGCVDTFRTNVVVKSDYMFYIPNSFTVNNDGKNEMFLATGFGIKEFKMQIYDRWGGLIFESNDINQGWDGKKGNATCPADIYVYSITIDDDMKKPHYYVGSVTLLK